MRRWELVLQACNRVTVALGIPNYRMQERMLVHVRRMLLRTGPSLRELGFLHGFLTMVETVSSRVQIPQTSESPHSSQVDAQSVKST
jgi:tRNA C32,U32 (ribose-2'-O)-methylase TrmJ